MSETLKNGRYKLLETWKSNTNGMLALALDTQTNKKVFVKEFYRLRYPAATTAPDGKEIPSLVEAKERVDRFYERTTKINGKINEIAFANGDVVVATDFFRDGLYIYKVSDLIEMEPWAGREVCEQLTVDEIDTLMLRLSNALQTLHSAGILHLDLKPENIFIIRDRDGMYVGMLSDFDDSILLDRVPHSRDIVCTLNYMSPEVGHYKQLEGDTPELPIGTGADVFSLGLIYHEYLTGEFPAFDENCLQLWATLLQGDELQLSSKLDPAHKLLLSRMMTTLPYDRIQTCAAVSAEIMNIRRRRKTAFTLTLTDGSKPLGKKKVRLYARITEENKDALPQSVELASGKTDKHGQIVFMGLTDCEYSVLVDGRELPVKWEYRETEKYACTVSTSAGNTHRLTVTHDGRPLTSADVRLALLDEAHNPVKIFSGRTDGSGVCTFDALPGGVYRAKVGSVAKIVRWDEARCAAFNIKTYTLQLMQDGAPVINEKAELVGVYGDQRVNIPVTSNSRGRVLRYNLNMKMRYTLVYNGRAYPVVWDGCTATVRLTCRTAMVAGVLSGAAKKPVERAQIRFGRIAGGAFEELASGMTNGQGAVMLGEFPEGEYAITVSSMPAGTKLTGRKPGCLTRVRLSGAKKTVVFAAEEDTESVTLDHEIPASESAVYSRIVKYRDGSAVLTERCDGSTVTVSVSQLALRGLEKYM